MGRKRIMNAHAIVSMMAKGCSGKEIATQLNTTEATIETWRQRLYSEYNVKNGPHLVAHFFQNKLIS